MGMIESFLGLLSKTNVVGGSKIDKASEKLIEENPEAFLDEDIKEKRTVLKQNKETLTEIVRIKNELIKKLDQKAEGLENIRVKITQASRDGDKEAVEMGTKLYQQRSKEYEELEKEVEDIKKDVEELNEIIKGQQKEIDDAETNKEILLAKLSKANSKEKVNALKEEIKGNRTTSVNSKKAEDIINSKINKTKARDEIETGSVSTKKDYFKGL